MQLGNQGVERRFSRKWKKDLSWGWKNDKQLLAQARLAA
jgi:hypothetical protein